MTDESRGRGVRCGARLLQGSPVLPGISRRDFLNGVLIGASGLAASRLLGACGGGGETTPGPDAGTLPPGQDLRELLDTCHAMRDGQSWELPAASGELYDCVIVGAGIAGLTAAWRLGRQGVTNVLLLDKDDPLGGLARSNEQDGLSYAEGAAYTVYPFNAELIELYTDLGVVTGVDVDGYPIVDPTYVVKAPTNNVYMNGQWFEDAWEAGMESLPLSQQALQDLMACRDEIDVLYNYVGADDLLAFDCPSDRSTTDADIRALDDISFAQWIADKGWDPAVTEFFTRYCASALGTTPDAVSAWGTLNFLGSEFYPVQSQPGGNACFAQMLADKIGRAKIKTNAFVLRVVESAGEVHVTYLEGGTPVTVRAQSAIYAAPRHIARYLVPGLSEAGRTEYTAFKYSAYLIANLHVLKTPAGLAYDNWVHDPCFFTDFVVADWAGLEDPASAPLDRPNVLTVYCPLIGPNDRADLQTQPFEYYEQKILADLERVLPGVTATITAVDLFRWGHPMLRPAPGFVFGAERESAQLPLGLISFATAEVDGLPAFENAVAAAWRASDEVLAVVSPV
jgi:phytoene dehydrogenase-like protein